MTTMKTARNLHRISSPATVFAGTTKQREIHDVENDEGEMIAEAYLVEVPNFKRNPDYVGLKPWIRDHADEFDKPVGKLARVLGSK